MSFIPSNYETRDIDITRLEEIAEANGFLQVLKMNPAWAAILENEAQIAEAVGSIGIEGTVISRENARAVTAGEQTDVDEKTKREYNSYSRALHHIKVNIDTALSKELVLEIHRIVTDGDKGAMPGRFRMDQRAVSRGDRIVFTPPPPGQLDVLIAEFVEWWNDAVEERETSPVILAALCHFWFVWIHPFADGNGRTARLLTTRLLLAKHSEGIRYFALSDYYDRHVDEYYDALEEANPCDPQVAAMSYDKNLSPWLSFFINSYLRQMEDIRNTSNRILRHNIQVQSLRESGLITEVQDKVLSYLYANERASYENLEKLLDVTQQRVNQVLLPLREAQVLAEERIGRKIWFSLGAPQTDTDTSKLKSQLKRESSRQLKKGVEKQGVLPIFSFK